MAAAKRTLLIADDDALVLGSLEISLSSGFWEIATAGDALQALIKAREIRPFCILTDVQMPAYGKGTDMIRALRMEKAIAATPVIVMTGMEYERAKRLLPPGDDKVRLISKPPKVEQILDLIRELTGIDGAAAPPP